MERYLYFSRIRSNMRRTHAASVKLAVYVKV
jgi:hypothetical protein